MPGCVAHAVSSVCVRGVSVWWAQAVVHLRRGWRDRTMRGLTLSHFQDHLHALCGAHSSSHAVQALAGPI